MNNFGSRLREERERLGYNQSDFGEVGGVKKLAQFNYEKGERVPDALYLSAIAAIGVDVLYILTGQRTSEMPPAPPLTKREQALLGNYRGSDDEGRRAVEATASALAHKDSGQERRRSGE